MTSYSVAVEIDQAHVKQYNSNQNWKLCFAAGVSETDGGEPNYNVIAYTQKVAAHVTIDWVEQYAIAASDSNFMNGVKFNLSTDITDIALGQTYVQPADFTDGTVNTDSAAPKNGFLFNNQADVAAAVVYKKIKGQMQPIYISQMAPLGPGTETLIPKLSVALWFSANAETNNMISNFSTVPLKLNMTNNQSHKASVKFDGHWTVVSNS